MLLLCLAFTIFGTSFTTADQYAQIIESKSSNDGFGNYEFRVRNSDGITLWQTGRLMYTSDNKPYIHVEGGYSYFDRELHLKRIVTFEADQNGYRPTSNQEPISTPPPQYYPSRFGSGASG